MRAMRAIWQIVSSCSASELQIAMWIRRGAVEGGGEKGGGGGAVEGGVEVEKKVERAKQ